jgi:RHS repeat-associated protein
MYKEFFHVGHLISVNHSSDLEDHLGSSNLVLDTDGVLVSKEEYYPFGETSFGSYGKKRYRFCGKEKDEESGLYYYGLRYYNPWSCRFINLDPLAAKYPFYTPYQYAGNKPINYIDLDGAEEKKADAPKKDSTSTGKTGTTKTGYGGGNAGKPSGAGTTVDNTQNSNNQVKPDFSKAHEAAESKSGYAGHMGTDIKNNSTSSAPSGDTKDVPATMKVFDLVASDEYRTPEAWDNLGEKVDLAPENPSELYHPGGIEDGQDRYTHMNDVFLTNENVTPQNFYDVVMGGFASGAGPENYLFASNSSVSQSLVNSDIVTEAHLNFLNSNAGNGSDPKNLMPWSGHIELPLSRGAGVSANGFIEQGTALTPEHFIGSAYVTVTPLSDGNLSVFVFNVTSIGSGSFNDPSSSRNTNNLNPQPWTNISQSFYLIIPMTGSR